MNKIQLPNHQINDNTPQALQAEIIAPPNPEIVPQTPTVVAPLQQTPSVFLSPSPKLDSGIGTAKSLTSYTPADVFQPLQETIQERREELKQRERTPSRSLRSPLISFTESDEVKKQKIRQAQRSEKSDLRKRIFEDPNYLNKSWISTGDDRKTIARKKHEAEKRKSRATQTYTPSEY